MSLDRRSFLRFAGAAMATSALPLSIQKALAIPANNRTGTIMDVEHVVILMQENRSFDHYFGTLPGVRGFGDRFPIPLANGKDVWHQTDRMLNELLPYHLDQTKGNAQRVEGTPHSWSDAHFAWDDGRMNIWPALKEQRSMGYYTEQELPFQFALANAFTICDAYHCAIASSTNPNRLFMFTGTNNPTGIGGGPAIDNTNDDLGASATGYGWMTYAERLEKAGVSWKVYQDMDDNFTDNSLEGFVSFRKAFENAAAEPNNPLLTKGLTSTLKGASLEGFKADVVGGKLPQVSYIVSTAGYSEHTGPSSPVQGAWYTQEVLNALTADPAVWAKTVLFVCFDENDGFFDHVPPPCPPTKNLDGSLAGGSTVDVSTEYRSVNHQLYDRNWVYGPGPRVPMYVVSPWSRGGWLNSQVHEHTSIIRFMEQRFGVMEPQISPWRRAVSGDLTGCFNFATPNDSTLPPLPQHSMVEVEKIRADQEALAQIAAPTGAAGSMPLQKRGVRPSRALPYELHASSRVTASAIEILFANTGTQAAVFQVYNKNNLLLPPRRYTVEAGKTLTGSWTLSITGGYDLFLLGPNGFHRSYTGAAAIGNAISSNPDISLCYDIANGDVLVTMSNTGAMPVDFSLTPNAYFSSAPQRFTVDAGKTVQQTLVLKDSGHWYDFTASTTGTNAVMRRFAGRVETGKPSISDPAMGNAD
ncbi:MAG: phospholipase C, phosphocholine-specific [Stagnimonas sp.]|nr:phospholipase C, phosphocholine-specific [Stagnimonas sp.]